MKIVLIICFFAYFVGANCQDLNGHSSTDWHLAGLQLPLPVYKQVHFKGYNDGVTDNISLFTQFLGSLTGPSIIILDTGTYLFTSRIKLPGNTVIKGLGNQQTRLLFTLNNPATPCIEIFGTENSTPFILPKSTLAGAHQIELAGADINHFTKGDYIRLLQNDSTLVHDNWALQSTGQIIRIDSISHNSLYFSTSILIPYPIEKKPQIRKLNPIAFSGIECLKIERTHTSSVSVGTGTISFRYAHHCWVSSVESVKCNSSHIDAERSANLYITDSYFHDAFSFGGGGSAYGVTLHFGTSLCLIENNIFRRLRHAMLVQAGANNNVFAYNYAYESRKEGLFNIITTGEDLVCHGNYPYHNIFEGNYAQFASVDNSHGKNGPLNTYFRNIATSQGFNVTNSESHNQKMVANHRLGGTNTIRATGHIIEHNSWQGTSAYNHPSLAYKIKPGYLSGSPWPVIGPPAFNKDASIPARNRVLQNQAFISRQCGLVIWDGHQWKNHFPPGPFTQDYDVIIEAGGTPVFHTDIKVNSITLKPGATLVLPESLRVEIKKSL